MGQRTDIQSDSAEGQIKTLTPRDDLDLDSVEIDARNHHYIPSATVLGLVALLRARDAEIDRLHHHLEYERARVFYRCPITDLPFFMSIESPDSPDAMLPTFGGPYDSYTVPEWDDEAKEWVRARYDHDRGVWVEGLESVDHLSTDEIERLREDIERLKGLLDAAWDASGLLGSEMTGQPGQAYEEPSDLVFQIAELAKAVEVKGGGES